MKALELRVRATTTAPVNPAPIVLERECTAIRLPRNDTLLVLTDDDVLTRWHLATDGSTRTVTALNVGPAREISATPWEDAMRGFKVVHFRPTHAFLAAPRSNAGLIVAPDGALVVFDLDENAAACARFPALSADAESLVRCAWIGRRAALIAPDGRIALFGADGASQMIASALPAALSALDSSPDGQSLVLGDANGGVTVCAFDQASGTATPGRHWHAHDGCVIAVVWLPNGTDVLTAGRDGALRVWNIATGERRDESVVVRPDDGGSLMDVLPCGDGGLVFVKSSEIHVSHAPWDEQIESVIIGTALYSTARALKCVGFKSDERILVSPDHHWRMNCASEPPSLEELRADGAREVATAPGPAGRAEALIGGATPVALAPRGNQIERWSFVFKSGLSPAQDAPDASPLTRCTELRFLSPHVLLSAHRGSAPFVRDAATGKPLGPIGEEHWKLRDIYLTPTGRHAVHTEYAAHLMHLDHTVISLGDAGTPPHTVREVPARTARESSRQLALAPSGDRFVFVVRGASPRPRVEVRDVVTNAVVLEAADPGDHATGWVLPGEPLRLVLRRSSYTDAPLVLWDVTASKAVTEIAGPTLAVQRICAHSDGTRLISYCPPTLSVSGPIVLWNFATSTSHVLEARDVKTSCVAFARDGRSAFSADEQAVTAWDLETFTRRWTLPLTQDLGQTPEHLHHAGDLLLVERGLFGPHLVVRVDDGACLGSVRGAHAAPVVATSGQILFGVIERGELVLHDAAGTPLARWRGAADAEAWAQAPEAPFAIAVGDACGEIALLAPPGEP